MIVYKIANLGGGTITAADLFTIAVNTLEVNATDDYALYVGLKAQGFTLGSAPLAGDNKGVVEVTPEFFPYATEGAECAAFVTSLTWADNNLQSYEYVVSDNGSTQTGYLVFGRLNSSKTEFNDPFQKVGDFKNGACWSGNVTTNFR